MKELKLWMRIIGGFYIFLGLINTPPVIAARMQMQYPALDLGLNHLAVKAINDLWFVFGVEMAVVGVMLLFASTVPLQNKILVQTVLVLELVRGIVMDIYWLSRGYYAPAPYIVWIIIHLAIVLSGWLLLRRAESNPEKHKAESSWPSDSQKATSRT